MKTGITLITMGAGNVIVLEETLKSFEGIINEVIYGDMLIFPEDREILYSYKPRYNLKPVTLPFNYLYKNGFSALLNHLASFASNDMVMYMNTGEVIDENYGINDIVDSNPECNSFYFTHREEKYRWFRLYDRKFLEWSGLIHESLQGEYRPYHKPVFMMKDLPKDMYDLHKAACFDSTKEIIYWKQLMDICDNPKLLGGTDAGWLSFAKDNYQNMSDRLKKKGKQPEAFELGDYNMLMGDLMNNKEFVKEEFKSSTLIEYQQNKIFLL